ncbi:protein TusB [bacterium MnTg03]|nr:protein TusB [bacterium MnTg03]
MSVLHIINKSPFEKNSLDTCLRLAKKGSAILLIEDAIYAAQKNTAVADKIIAAVARHSVYALAPDLDARGIDESTVVDGISLVDYEGFVRLATEYHAVQSWL